MTTEQTILCFSQDAVLAHMLNISSKLSQSCIEGGENVKTTAERLLWVKMSLFFFHVCRNVVGRQEILEMYPKKMEVTTKHI